MKAQIVQLLLILGLADAFHRNNLPARTFQAKAGGETLRAWRPKWARGRSTSVNGAELATPLRTRPMLGMSREESMAKSADNKETTDINDEDEIDQKLGLKRIQVGDREFWTKQKALVQEMTAANERALRKEQLARFAQRRLDLVADTAYFGTFIFCSLWLAFDNPFVAFSYVVGATMGLAYAFGLGKYVETLGASVEDKQALQGAGVGEARFAFLIILFILVGKFRSSGLLEIPAIAGFFTYQLASLSQGLREIND